MNRFWNAILAVTCLTTIVPPLQAQPSLLPPGPPLSPSGRMGVRSEIRSLPYTIGAPGSYYFSQNLVQTLAGSPGITIAASGVTIDLNGFGMLGMGTPGDHGIALAPGAFRDITIYNGFVSGWGGNGIQLSGSTGAHVWEITVDANAAEGITLGTEAILRHVIAHNNILAGIRTDRYCKLTNCVATSNTGPGIMTGPGCHISDSVAGFNSSFGMAPGPGCTLVACTALNNGSHGFMLSMSCKASDCTATDNGFTIGGAGSGFFCGGDGNSLNGCTALNNYDSGFNSIPAGIFGGSSAQACVAQSNGFGSGMGDGFTNLKTILQCQANGNFDNGIEVLMSAKVMNNACNGNGANGIEANADGNAIEENQVVGNGIFGISTLPNPGPMGNIATRNRAHANAAAPFAFLPAFDTTGVALAGPIVLGVIGAHMANIAY